MILRITEILSHWDNNELNECNGVERNILRVWEKRVLATFLSALLIVPSTAISFLTFRASFDLESSKNI